MKKTLEIMKILAGMLAAVGAVMSCAGVMVPSEARKAIDPALQPTCGAPVEPTIYPYLVEKYGEEFWRAIAITGGAFIVLSVVLFVFLILKENVKEDLQV